MAILFSSLKRVTSIDKVVVHSIELALYQVSVVIDGIEVYVKETEDKFLRFNNPIEIQRAFSKIPYKKMVLRHTSAYDEMVGHDYEKGDNAMEVPFGKNNLY